MTSSAPLSVYVSRVREMGLPVGDLNDTWLLTPSQITQIFGGVAQAIHPLLLMAKLGLSVKIAESGVAAPKSPSGDMEIYRDKDGKPTIGIMRNESGAIDCAIDLRRIDVVNFE